MSDLSLDLKYRPRKFSEVLGNAGVRKLLLTRSRGGTLAGRSMMFGGPKGCGKTSFARVAASALACQSLEDGEPCGQCDACLSVRNGSHPDIQEFDAASQGTVDKIREMVREADYGTLNGGKCVYLLDEAQRLSLAAQDALLTPVEGRDFIVILCTTEPHKIKPPIRSRVEEYPITAPPEAELVGWLKSICEKESIPFEESALKSIAKYHNNCPRVCVLSLESASLNGKVDDACVRQLLRFDSFELLVNSLAAIDSDPARGLSMLDTLASKESPTWIRDSIVWAIASGIRIDVGASSNFPVPIGKFYQTRLSGWLDLSTRLSSIDKPIMADIEAAIFSQNRSLSSVQALPAPIPAPLPLPPPPAPSPSASPVITAPVAAPVEAPTLPTPPVPAEAPKAISEAPKATSAPSPAPSPPVNTAPIHVDGVRYTSEERLTTLDDKIPREPVPASDGVPKATSMPVEFNNSSVPLTKQEFISGILRRS